MKQWLAAHRHHPYPTVEDVEVFTRQTGLSKQQILNWFANARRRGKATSPSSTTAASCDPNVTPSAKSGGLSIRRPSTPFPEQQGPLERWRNSPPEDEPVSASAIASALYNASHVNMLSADAQGDVSISSCLAPSLYGSSASSADASDSSQGSHASFYSCTSDVSHGSFEFRRKTRRRRRRRVVPHNTDNKLNTLSRICHRYQCTFCTETFQTKHSWQRHEKTMHLSLERWECAPDGPLVLNGLSQTACVYCGLVQPDETHFESHNHDSCHDRDLVERTFYRKDHLLQHLRLVHQVQNVQMPIETWRTQSGKLQSRCGFCDTRFITWKDRVDHLAEHFKEGKTMGDWRGTWGFDAPTLEMVENSMPPCE